jgi:isoleucyl-tRNA synthetase
VLEGSVSFSAHDVLISRDVSKLSKSDANLEYGSNAGNAVVVMDFTPREDLIQMALAREVSNKVQKLRKNIGLNMKDNIVVYLGSEDEHTQSVLALRHEYIESIVKKPVVVLESHAAPSLDDSDEVANTVEDLNEAKLRIIIRRRH